MAPQAPVGRRERKKAATRQATADAALRLFLERGYDAMSTRDVAEAADASSTTLFKHFATKEAAPNSGRSGAHPFLARAVTQGLKVAAGDQPATISP